jgi:1-acyl-sn-glycerol-3-phosphate acyltransferase
MTVAVSDFVAEQLELNKRRRILHPILRAIIPIFSEVDANGLENIPKVGGAMLLGNHISVVDPILLTGAIPNRFMISMAKAETLNHPVESFGLKAWGNFVVNRGEVDRTALNNSIDLLNAGQILWIAAEGTRNPDGMGEVKGGVAYIAHKADTVVIPTAICGAQGWDKTLMRFKRVPVKIFFGRPFRFVLPEGERLSREVRDAMMTEGMYQVAKLMPEEFAFQRGFYSDIGNATTKYIQFC